MSVEDIGELSVVVSVLVPVPLDVDDLLGPLELFTRLPEVDELSMLVPLVEPVPLVERPVELLSIDVDPFERPVDEPLLAPLTDPVERLVLPFVVPVAPVLEVLPAFGPEPAVLLLGEPEAPPFPPASP